jgi:presenilin-like A22 family membrane protease
MTEEKTEKRAAVFPMFLMGGLFVIIHLLSMLITKPFEDTGFQAFEDANDPMNLLVFFVILIAVTVTILLIAKFWKKQFIQVIILGSIAYTSFFVFYPLLSFAFPYTTSTFLAVIAAAILIVALIKHPEWYIINLCGIIVGVGAIGLFGISLSIFLVIILLIGLSIYDAISVYKTKHMIDLADAVMDLKLPVMLVVPKTRQYSILKETKGLKEKLEKRGARSLLHGLRRHSDARNIGCRLLLQHRRQRISHRIICNAGHPCRICSSYDCCDQGEAPSWTTIPMQWRHSGLHHIQPSAIRPISWFNPSFLDPPFTYSAILNSKNIPKMPKQNQEIRRKNICCNGL